MQFDRPDLSNISSEVLVYIRSLEAEIEDLEAEIDLLKTSKSRSSRRGRAVTRTKSTASEDSADLDAGPAEPSEAPTTLNLITISQAGRVKRTLRHHYLRQRRGGMGIFDLEVAEADVPHTLAIADESDYLILITNEARAFRLRVARLEEQAIRSRGQDLKTMFPLHDGEYIAAALPEKGQSYAIILTERGHVRHFRANYFGETLRAGLVLFDTTELGVPAAACWGTGSDYLFIATRTGRAIRFPEKLVPVRGCLGIRLSPNDPAVAVTTVTEDGGVFLMSADGKGTIRLMSGFAENKSAGTGGKIAMKTDSLVAAQAVDNSDDIFAISNLSKIIRFQAEEVPPKEGVVQGVNAMALRADEVKAVIVSKQ